MKKLLLLLWFIPALAADGQQNEADNRQAERQRQRDSAMDYYQRKRDSLVQAEYLADTALIRQQVRNSADYFVKLQQEQRRKQRRTALMRIGFGLAILGLLVFAYTRRRKKQG